MRPPVLALLACVGGVAAAAPQPVTVGSKAFTESVILGEVVAGLLREQGTPVRHRRELGGTRVLWSALIRGDIDLYPEYTGTLREEILAQADLPPGDPDALRARLAAHGVAMSAPLGFDNTYALGMREELAARLGIETISDLREHPGLALGFSNEFMDREDGWPGLRRHYRLAHRGVQGLDHDLAYRALAAGDIQVTDLYTTDAEIRYYGLRVLADDRGYFPAYEAVLVYRTDLARRVPGAIARLERLAGAVDRRAMVAMNARVKLEGASEGAAAAELLEERLGIRAPAAEPTPGSRLLRRGAEHLYLVGVSLAGAVVIAVPLGMAAARRPRAGQVILGAVGILQTVPSLALLVFMIPLLGIGAAPAIAALFLYSLLPIVRNTHAGLTDIPGSVVESAAALGLPPMARLRLVKLPLAARGILAGVKTSAVINVGTATLGALIGAGGFGQPILTGIRLDDLGLILQGAVPAAGLALAAQGLFELVERGVVPRGLRLPKEAP